MNLKEFSAERGVRGNDNCHLSYLSFLAGKMPGHPCGHLAGAIRF